mgnify:CR=1 FL=1
MTPEQEKIYYDKMEQNFPHFLSAMEKLVAIPSYLEEDTYPQVTSLHEVLAATLELLQEMGYKTYADPEGYYGYAEIGQGGQADWDSGSLGRGAAGYAGRLEVGSLLR